MATREQHGPPFDEQALGEALGTRPATVRDVAYGEGQLFSAGRGAARLEVFPQTRVTRLTAQDMRVELFGTTIAALSPDGVEFHRDQPGQQASLAIVPGGGVVFIFVAGGERTPPTDPQPEEIPGHPVPDAHQPERGPETAREPETDADPPALAAVVQLPAARHTLPAGSSSPSEPRADSPAESEVEPERLQLTGRLGRDPSFRTTKTGTLVGKFPLAVHQEDGQTSWHSVLAFGNRAEQLQRRVQAGELSKGREVDVVGYLHTNSRPGEDGTPRKVQEVYAVAVRKR